MFSHYPAHIERDMGCTEAEWLRALPAAMGDVPWRQDGASVSATLGDGGLRITWRQGEPRVIALMRMPRLHVVFDFQDVDELDRRAFMKRFDLYMQRGGG